MKKTPVNSAAGLPPRALAEYLRKGYIKVGEVYDANEVAAFAGEADRLLGLHDLMHEDNLRTLIGECAGGRGVLQINTLHDISDIFRAVIADRRIYNLLSSIYNGSTPAVFKDKIIYKPQGAQGAKLHQDYAFWQGFPTSLVTVVVSIDAADRQNGCVKMYPGWERGLLPRNEFLCVRDGEFNPEEGEYIETAPGDVIIFNCMVPHASDPNMSDRPRRQLFLSYNDGRDGDHYGAHQQHFLEYTRRYFMSDEQRRRSYYK